MQGGEEERRSGGTSAHTHTPESQGEVERGEEAGEKKWEGGGSVVTTPCRPPAPAQAVPKQAGRQGERGSD